MKSKNFPNYVIIAINLTFILLFLAWLLPFINFSELAKALLSKFSSGDEKQNLDLARYTALAVFCLPWLAPFIRLWKRNLNPFLHQKLEEEEGASPQLKPSLLQTFRYPLKLSLPFFPIISSEKQEEFWRQSSKLSTARRSLLQVLLAVLLIANTLYITNAYQTWYSVPSTVRDISEKKVLLSYEDQRLYLQRLVRQVDTWFLTSKLVAGTIAVLESSTLQVGSFISGSLSLGELLEPLRMTLEHISRILFYSRIFLTFIQLIQYLGEHYNVALLRLLLFIQVLYAVLGNLSALARPKGALGPQTSESSTLSGRIAKSLFQLINFHLLFFFFLNLSFIPIMHQVDKVFSQSPLQTELDSSERKLQGLQDDLNSFSQEDSAISSTLKKIQAWLLNTKAQLRMLSYNLLNFAITAAIRTIILPLSSFFLLYLLYKNLVGQFLHKK